MDRFLSYVYVLFLLLSVIVSLSAPFHVCCEVSDDLFVYVCLVSKTFFSVFLSRRFICSLFSAMCQMIVSSLTYFDILLWGILSIAPAFNRFPSFSFWQQYSWYVCLVFVLLGLCIIVAFSFSVFPCLLLSLSDSVWLSFVFFSLCLSFSHSLFHLFSHFYSVSNSCCEAEWLAWLDCCA